MPLVHHNFPDHKVSENTEILIIGTFHPEAEVAADFFYGRPRNYLWSLLPGCWNQPSLKDESQTDKETLMEEKRIDFCDLIQTIDVEPGEENNVADIYIDRRIVAWQDTIALITQLKKLKAVYFTRKTFQQIPNIKQRIRTIQNHCHANNIRFSLLNTPSRHGNATKQEEWQRIIAIQNLTLVLP